MNDTTANWGEAAWHGVKNHMGVEVAGIGALLLTHAIFWQQENTKTVTVEYFTGAFLCTAGMLYELGLMPDFSHGSNES